MKRILAFAAFALAAGGFRFLDARQLWPVPLGGGHTLWEFLALVAAVLAVHQLLALCLTEYVRWRKGPPGEAKMLIGFVRVLAVVVVVIALVYSLGLLKAISAVVAGFVGLLLGWSLQAPVSGMAAWMLITLKRPFRVGDRVLFPSLGLNGDVKHIGLMYTVLDQVGGAIGSEEAIGRDILIPNAMLFGQVAINYTPRATAAYFLDEVVIRMTYDSDWDTAEQILLNAAREVTSDIIRATGQEPYIRSDIWDYGILLRLRYMTMAKDRPRITHEIVKRIFKEVQRNPRVDMAIPYVYSYRRSAAIPTRAQMPEPEADIQEIPMDSIEEEGVLMTGGLAPTAEEETLMRNIQEKGLLQPIVVESLGEGRYRVIAGQRRYLACKRLGWKTIPAVVRSGTRARGQASSAP